MFKIALSAGHYLKTAGKRCLKKLDKNETREWVLNDRICDKIEEKLKAYDGYQLLRVDDTTGATDVSIANRCKKANSWGADFYLSIHHNAGINGGTGGGVVAYTYTNVDVKTASWQKELYDAIIAKTGLKGNRSTPLAKANLAECRLTNMAAVLLECGFMDSATDVPVILTEEYADKLATACVEVIVKKGKLTKKVVVEQPTTGAVYRVQVGAYSVKANAEKLVESLKKDGYDAYITT
ncbi:MAG: N-acetylmuramoyl-L-alanine amidase [Bacteroidaceae bacterium]|nr:N-acetylmuramoyl-L-alanine amidase [Bacteroidaceae bacterium]